MEITIDLQGMTQYREQMTRLMVHLHEGGKSNLSGGEKTLHDAIVKYMNEAEAEFRIATIDRLGSMMPNDPRGAHVAVSRGRVMSRRGMIVGKIGIYEPKRAGSVKSSYVPARKLDENPHQVGGNRRKRSAYTRQKMSYGPRDRGFILRFLEGGTNTRDTKYGNRGSLTATGNFGKATRASAEAVAISLVQKIDAKIEQLMSDGAL